MKKTRMLGFLVALALPLAAGAAPAPFASGEKLLYEISLVGIRAAEAELRIEESGGGWRMHASGKTVGATDSIFGLRQTASCSAGAELLPTLCRFDSKKRGSVYRKEVRFDRKTGVVRERVLGHDGRRQEKSFEFEDGLADVQDALSGFYRLRQELPGPGATVRFRSMRKGKPLHVEAKYVREERVETELGALDAVVVELKILEKVDRDAAKRATIWFTKDARHLPVRLSVDAPVGSLEAALVAATGTVEVQVAEARPAP